MSEWLGSSPDYANCAPWEAARIARVSATHGGDWNGVPALAWPSAGHCDHSGSDPAHGKLLPLLLSLLFSLLFGLLNK